MLLLALWMACITSTGQLRPTSSAMHTSCAARLVACGMSLGTRAEQVLFWKAVLAYAAYGWAYAPTHPVRGFTVEFPQAALILLLAATWTGTAVFLAEDGLPAAAPT